MIERKSLGFREKFLSWCKISLTFWLFLYFSSVAPVLWGQRETPGERRMASGLEQPTRRDLQNPYDRALPEDTAGEEVETETKLPAEKGMAPGLDIAQPKRRELEGFSGLDAALEAEEPADTTLPESIEPIEPIEPNALVPPYPNYPESVRPQPPREPRQQEYLYLNHIYVDPLAFAVSGWISLGWIGMMDTSKALRLGGDIYIPVTNLGVILSGNQNNPDYYVIGLLMRLGLHFFLERTQLKGFEIGIDLRAGIVIAPASGNAVIVQAMLELPVSYRFVLSFYTRSGRQGLNLGFAPYITIGFGGFFATSGDVVNLRNTDGGLDQYMTSGDISIEPNFIMDISPLALKLALRFGFDISLVF